MPPSINTVTTVLKIAQQKSGNGHLTYDEQKAHFTAWALMKSPLLIGTDVRLLVLFITSCV